MTQIKEIDVRSLHKHSRILASNLDMSETIKNNNKSFMLIIDQVLTTVLFSRVKPCGTDEMTKQVFFLMEKFNEYENA